MFLVGILLGESKETNGTVVDRVLPFRPAKITEIFDTSIMILFVLGKIKKLLQRD